MSETVEVRCEVCGVKWDPRTRVMGALGCPNALEHPEIHRLTARLAEVEKEVAPARAAQAERDRRRGAFWLTTEGRDEIRDTWDDPNDGNIALPLLNALEAAEAALNRAREDEAIAAMAWHILAGEGKARLGWTLCKCGQPWTPAHHYDTTNARDAHYDTLRPLRAGEGEASDV